jgi:hypothetical protein
MRRVILALILGGVATAASAEPVYLECHLTSQPTKQWKLFLDEENRAAKVFSEGKLVTATPPIFGPTSVMFYTGQKPDVTVFNIDRTDLSAQIGFGAGPWKKAMCEIPKLKF